MDTLGKRIERRAGVALAGKLPVAEIVERLESGEDPVRLCAAASLQAADLIAALGCEALGDEGAAGPSLVRNCPRRPRLLGALSEPAWSHLLPRASRPARLSLAAGLLQIHDFWEASHEAAQEADDLGERVHSAFWHGIAHRREPDPGNAAYWFRRVGRHPVFATLAECGEPLLEARPDSPAAARLLGRGAWDPFAFIDLCTASDSSPGTRDLALALQRLELTLLLDATADSVLPPV